MEVSTELESLRVEVEALRAEKRRTENCRGRLALWLIEVENLNAREKELMQQLRESINNMA